MFSTVLEPFLLTQECSGGGKTSDATAPLKPDPARGLQGHGALLEVFPEAPRKRHRQEGRGFTSGKWPRGWARWRWRQTPLGTAQGKGEAVLQIPAWGGRWGRESPISIGMTTQARHHAPRVPCPCSVARSSGQARSLLQEDSRTPVSFPGFPGLRFWAGFFCRRWEAVAAGSRGSRRRVAGKR